MPLGALDRDLRSLAGRVVSLGCGHGLVERYISEINPAVSVDGYELDADRVAAAAASGHLAPRVVVHAADVTELPSLGQYDAAIAVDVFHHVPHEAHARIASTLLGVVRAGGTMLIKDMDVRPRWKHGWNQTHDRLVAKETVHCRAPEDMAAVFSAAGWEVVDWRRVERRLSPYPQYLIRLARPA